MSEHIRAQMAAKGEVRITIPALDGDNTVIGASIVEAANLVYLHGIARLYFVWILSSGVTHLDANEQEYLKHAVKFVETELGRLIPSDANIQPSIRGRSAILDITWEKK